MCRADFILHRHLNIQHHSILRNLLELTRQEMKPFGIKKQQIVNFCDYEFIIYIVNEFFFAFFHFLFSYHSVSQGKNLKGFSEFKWITIRLSSNIQKKNQNKVLFKQSNYLMLAFSGWESCLKAVKNVWSLKSTFVTFGNIDMSSM